MFYHFNKKAHLKRGEPYSIEDGFFCWLHPFRAFLYSSPALRCGASSNYFMSGAEVNPESWTQLKGSNEKGI